MTTLRIARLLTAARPARPAAAGESPSNQRDHGSGNAETYDLIGAALGRALARPCGAGE